MAEYLASDVYVKEFDSGVRAMDGVGTSVAGFVGLAEKGPIIGRPVLISSFAEYQNHFGGYLPEEEYSSFHFLPYAVEQFFTNGGRFCYIMRVAPKDATTAQTAAGPIRVTARNPGSWANTTQLVLTRCVRACTQVLAQDGETGYQLKNADGFRTGDVFTCRRGETISYHKVITVTGNAITAAPALPADVLGTDSASLYTLEACGVDLQISGNGPEEKFTGCSLNPSVPDYLPTMVEKSASVTLTLQVEDTADDPLVLLGGRSTDTELRIALCGGTNGTPASIDAEIFNGTGGSPGQCSGIEAFREIDNVSIMAVPGVTEPLVLNKLIAHCESLADRFAVLDAPACASANDLLTCRSFYDSSYAALYAPWVEIFDPLRQRSLSIPPSGSVCGIYARVDETCGFHKAPANETLHGCTGLSVLYTDTERTRLNPNGVNLFCSRPGLGLQILGARTCSNDDNWKYVNIRRLFIYLKESLLANTCWAVYEPNDEALWNRVKSTASLFLETQRLHGVLAGATPEEAYYIHVGTDTMTLDDIRNGQLICEIGAAPIRPGQFITFRITQNALKTT